MSTTEKYFIWQPATGITDIAPPWRDLAASEIESIKKIWAEQQDRLKGTRQLAEFTERLSREWAIETGIIENLYQIDRGVTQTLIERGFQAEFLTHGSTNKPISYVLHLLRDQQDALEGIFDFIAQRRILSVSYIKELHAALVRSQEYTDAQDASGRIIGIPLIKGDWKQQPNYPTKMGVVYSYCPPEQVASEMDRLVAMHHAHLSEGVPPEVEAAWLHHRFSQIHPFQDGNGRVCRALASMVLMRAGLFPLIVTRDDKTQYLDALEAADKGGLKPLVNLFATLQRTQFRKATALSENIIAAGADIDSMMQSLMRTAEKSRESREQDQRRVFQNAEALEEETVAFLETLVGPLRQVLLKISPHGKASVSRSTSETSHFYRAQIIENANRHLDYHADTASYRSWVALNLVWERKASLVFAIHGIGRPFSGSLVCAPFFEFRDDDDEAQVRSTVVPVADEAFVFFHNEPFSSVRERFRIWRDKVMTVALKQLEQSL
ncbi:MAG: Fic family protein [Verrucomicrobiaceae bacterium]|nr:MAG: Fic family protein [Verrucomicrobiaceae bacterium]